MHPIQTKAWEEFRKEWGNEVSRVNGHLLTIHKIPFFGKIAIFEKGPVPTQATLTKLTKFGRQSNLIFIKLEPNCVKSDKLVKLVQSSGALPGKTLFTPTTFWIDLTRPEDDILKSFHPKTRYNIRLAQKNGVEVKEDNSDKAFETYLKLMAETVERDKFYAHNERYHRLMWKHLHKTPIAKLLIAKYKGEIVTAWILFAYDGVLYYPYGASTHKYKNIMANNLMMWEAIRFGKKLGLKTFDLWGREPGKGFTRFKEGYNPKVVEFLGTWDLVISRPLYWIYRITETIRWPLLRLKSKIAKPEF